MRELTKAQERTLRAISRRDYPAGEPRRGWYNGATLRVLHRLGLINWRPGSIDSFSVSPIIDLTEAGRSALSKRSGDHG